MLSAAEVLTILVWGAWRGCRDKAALYFHLRSYHRHDFPTLGAYRWNGPSLCDKRVHTNKAQERREGSCIHVTTLGIDLAKQVFHVYGADAQGHEVFRKRLSRLALKPFLATLPPCVIGMEACGGAHYWARELAQCGHTCA